MSKTKEYWWVSVGGNDCEPAVVVDKEIFTFGCKDALTTKDVELCYRIDDVPPTPKQAERQRIRWEKKKAADAKRGIFHGYRQF